MANRNDFYFRQKVTEAELDGSFESLELADFNQIIDHGLVGVTEGLEVTEKAGTPNLSVDITTGTAYSKDGERIRVPSLQNLDVSQDDSAVSTAVGSGGNFKIVSVFAIFDRVLSDPRLDGNSVTVFFVRAESFQFSVIQSAESVTPTPPAIDPDKILLADITRSFGQTQILNGDISYSRRESVFNVDIGSITFTAGNVQGAITEIAQAVDDHVQGVGVAHDTTAIDGVADSVGGSSVSADTLDVQIGELLALIEARAKRGGDTFTGAVVHENVISLGTALISTEANGLIPRLDVPAVVSGERTLFSRSIDAGSTFNNIRMYVSKDGGIEIVRNAYWDGTNWTQDNAASNSSIIELNVTGIRRRSKNAGAVPWGNASWDFTTLRFEGNDTSEVQHENGRIRFVNPVSGIGDSNPPQQNGPGSNFLLAKNIPKAWGVVRLDSNGDIDSSEGFNFLVPGNPGSSSQLTITFDDAMDTNAYAAVVSTMTGGDFTFQVNSELAGSFNIQARKMTTAATLPYDDVSVGSGLEVSFVVFGVQS